MSNTLKLLIGIYLIVAVVTYGNASRHFDSVGKTEVAECFATAKNTDFCGLYKASGAAAALSTIFWPLYWSYLLQKEGVK